MCKKIRINRLFHTDSDKIFILPIDHGVTLGPVQGIETYCNTVKVSTENGVDSVVVHKGTLKKLIEHNIYEDFSYIMHLSASTTFAESTHHKVLVTQVEEALKYGADGISIHVNLGGNHDADMLRDFGSVSEKCEQWGIPLLAMMYAPDCEKDAGKTAHLVKIAQELGADLVKISYKGDIREIESCIVNTDISVVLAGGSCNNNIVDTLTMIDTGMKHGIKGVAIGRNIFQSGQIDLYTRLIGDIVHGKDSLEHCIQRLGMG